MSTHNIYELFMLIPCLSEAMNRFHFIIVWTIKPNIYVEKVYYDFSINDMMFACVEV